MSRRLVGDYLVPAEGAGDIINGGAVDFDTAGRITAVGPESALDPPTGPVERIGGLLMPGLVNAHAHTPMTLVRSAGDGLPLQQWLTDAVWPREANFSAQDVWWGMTLGSAEMLLAGVTTSCEMYFRDEHVIDAVTQSGARLVWTPGALSIFLDNNDVGPYIDAVTAVHAAHHDSNSRITVGVAPHSPYDLSAAQIGDIARAARQMDTVLHIHLEETRAERELVIERDGMSATRALAEQGVLEGPVLAAHGVWLDETDRRLLAEADAAVAHCPVSNLKLGSGIAPLVELLDAGVRVGLGTDGVASNDDLDLWQELKLAPLLARGTQHDPSAIDAATALGLATRDAALAVGLPDAGELRVGAWADVIRIDLDQPAFTPGRNAELLTHLVFAGSSRFVTDVWVAGRRVVQAQQCLTVDVPTAVAQCRKRGARVAADAL